MSYQELPIEEQKYIINNYIEREANEIVKEFIASIKDSLKDTRKIVHGTECETLKEFGSEILHKDKSEEIGSVTFYADFEDPRKLTCRVMTMKQIKEGIKEGKTLNFIEIRYTGKGIKGSYKLDKKMS